MKGLYVEDDLELSKVVIENLEERGVFVKWTRSVKDSIEALKNETFSFYILDLGLTDGEGFDVADYIKQNNLRGPLIFLTARSEAKDRLKGYEFGACEYIPKPFLFEELWIRLDHALSEHGEPDIFRLAKDLVFDFKAQQLNYDESSDKKLETVKLSLKESLFLKQIIEESPKAVRRSEVLDKVWGDGKYPTERTVDNLVLKLRQKLGASGQRVESIRGVGYKWSEDKYEH
jgi:DNA-binding response OmpR family regulator